MNSKSGTGSAAGQAPSANAAKRHCHRAASAFVGDPRLQPEADPPLAERNAEATRRIPARTGASAVTRCPVLFEDDTLIVVNKPSGVLSHPNRTHPLSTKKPPHCAYEGAYDFQGRRFKTPAGPLWLIHRLDQDASGALLAAKTEAAARRCRFLFEHYEVQRSYLSVVARQPEPQHGKWRDRLGEQKQTKRVRAFIEPRGKPNAELIYKVQKYFPASRLSLIYFELVTGKTHQIRIQAAYHRHPIAGDDIYGDFKLNRRLRKSIGLRRLFLHAWRLKLKHPVSGQKIEIEAPLPEELEESLERMA